MQIPYISRISVSKLAVPLVLKMVLKIGILATALVSTSSATLAGGVLSANKKVTTNTPKSNALPVLQKHATSVSNASGGNYTVDWVVQYANTSGQTITNATVKDGAISTIIPGSLQQPAGWTGVTSSGNTIATWTGTSVPPFGVMTAPFPVAMSSTLTFSGSGDGYQPIPYTKISAPSGPRIYVRNHHQTPNAVLFKCLDLTSGTDCMGWTGGKKLPMGDSSSDGSGTMGNTAEYEIINGKMYYAAMGVATSGKMGIGCYDLETESKCGLTLFTASRPLGLLINGPWRVGNELYVAGTNGTLYCATLPALGFCVGASYALPAVAIKVHVDLPAFDNVGANYLAGKVIGDKLFITSTKSGNKYTNCFNATTKTACWSATLPTIGTSAYSYASSNNVSNFLYYNTGGTAIAICSMQTASPYQYCVDATTGTSVTLPVVFPGLHMGAGLEADASASTGKTYFVSSLYQANNHKAYCWDWTTANVCTGTTAGLIATHTPPLADYGSNVDDQGCIWVYGDPGVPGNLWHFDPNNIDPNTQLAKPCGAEAGKFIKVFQPLKYCSGAKPFHWLSVAVTGAPITNYTAFTINVLHPTSNAVLLTQNLMPAGPMLVDISSLDAQTLSQPLKIEVVYTPKPNVHDKPILEVHYDGPPMEFCFKSEHKCDQGPITNKVSTEFPDNQSARASFGGQSNAKAKLYTAQANAPTAPGCPSTCGTAGQPLCPLCDCLGNPVPVCGTLGQPPCPKCGQVGQPPCPACGQAGQPLCPDCNVPPPNGGGTATPKNASQPRSSATNSSIYK